MDIRGVCLRFAFLDLDATVIGAPAAIVSPEPYRSALLSYEWALSSKRKIYRHHLTTQTSHLVPMASFLDPRIISPDKYIVAPNRTQSRKDAKHAYASFGESDTTVSINAYGHILQMSQFLGHGASGFLCAEASDLPEPYCVQSRMNALMRSTQDPKTGLRLDVVNDWTVFQDCADA